MGDRRAAIVIVNLTLVLSGCYSYRGGGIAPVDPSTFHAPKLERVVVATIRVNSDSGGDSDLAGMVEREIEAALRNAGAEMKESGAVANPDSTLEVNVWARGSTVGQVVSGLISGFTFLLIPAYANVPIEMVADITGGNGSGHRYRYADDLTLWIQLFLLPVTNESDLVTRDLIADMARSLARDMQRDGLLPPPVSASAAAN